MPTNNTLLLFSAILATAAAVAGGQGGLLARSFRPDLYSNFMNLVGIMKQAPESTYKEMARLLDKLTETPNPPTPAVSSIVAELLGTMRDIQQREFEGLASTKLIETEEAEIEASRARAWIYSGAVLAAVSAVLQILVLMRIIATGG